MSRIVIKISGEALKGQEEVVSKEKLEMILSLIDMLKNNHQIAIVIGGGNFFRGREHLEMDKVTGDTIGMLASLMNALYVKDYLIQKNIKAIVTSPFTLPNLLPNYDDAKLNDLYQNGNIIIFGAGIGQSGYSTDSGTILALNKLQADLIIKMTNVDGVYDSDPKINKDSHMFKKLTYQDVITNNYQVIDSYVVKECALKHVKILVMNFDKYNQILDYWKGKEIGTIIGEEDGMFNCN